jgi:tRNA(fMet)-specific endonuclease VapC
MALFLLDANIVIAAMKGAPQVRRRLEETPVALLRLSAIVLGELEFGAEKSRYAQHNRARLAELTRSLPLVGIDAETTRHYAQIRATLERQGKPIGANDLWIAAQALSIDATLVTNNLREFKRVPDLALANWMAD